jgi:hypothetical protein
MPISVGDHHIGIIVRPFNLDLDPKVTHQHIALILQRCRTSEFDIAVKLLGRLTQRRNIIVQ